MTSIERVNELIKEKHANWIGISNQVAIKDVLDKLGKAEVEARLGQIYERDYLELKKILHKMADTLRYYCGLGQDDVFCTEICRDKYCDKESCKGRIIEYFEKKVGE